MKKVSAKVFFTVLWRGICQALGWFFGLFGYKRDGRAAHIIWGVFAVSGTVAMAIVALALVYGSGRAVYEKYQNKHFIFYSALSEYVSRDICFQYYGDSDGFVYNVHDGTCCIKGVSWIARPLGHDSLVCFSNGKKRGYFNAFTGEVVVKPRYNHAWVFSDGLAAVEEDHYIKFIDSQGRVVIDNKMAYVPGTEGYVFRGGYCVVTGGDGRHYGLMDKTGKLVMPYDYRSIVPCGDGDYWTVKKGREMAVLGKDLKPILPLMEGTVYIGAGTIDVTMPDHTMRKYDMKGKLLDDFYITGVTSLEYETDEIRYKTVKVADQADETASDDSETPAETAMEPYHVKATARMRAYTAGDDFKGLISPDGQVVTKPLYNDIEAIGYDTYLATVSNGDAIVINGKGENVMRTRPF